MAQNSGDKLAHNASGWLNNVPACAGTEEARYFKHLSSSFFDYHHLKCSQALRTCQHHRGHSMRLIPMARYPSWSDLSVMATTSRSTAKQLFKNSNQNLGALAFGEKAIGNHTAGYVAALIGTAHRYSRYVWETPTNHGE